MGGCRVRWGNREGGREGDSQTNRRQTDRDRKADRDRTGEGD